MELLDQLEQLQPFGMGNRQPMIRVGPLELKGSIRHFGRGHLSGEARGRDGGSVRLLGWGWQERQEDLAGDFEVLGCLELDRYLKTPVLRLVDARPWSESPAST